MVDGKPLRRGIIYLTMLVALLLAILPLPPEIEPFRPDWVMLVLLYWVLALPHRVNVGSALVLGLVLDLLGGGVFGVKGLALALMAYIAAMNFHLIRNFAVIHQALVIGGLTFVGKLIIFWGHLLMSEVPVGFDYFWSVISTVLLWPWAFLLLRMIRRKFSIG